MSLSFQSTLSVRRATAAFVDKRRYINISIHALRKESDAGFDTVQLLGGISIHALRKESDFSTISAIVTLGVFQSTLSVRRATYPP